MFCRFVAISFALLSPSAFACGGAVGWETPAVGTPAITFAQAQEQAALLGVTVKKSNAQAKCGSDFDYDVTLTAGGKQLGSVPVPSASEKADDGRSLLLRVQQLLKTPVEQLLDLREAQERFYEDSSALQEELGLSAYVPNALAIEQRTENNGQLFVVYPTISHHCSETYYSSPFNLKVLGKIPTLEYVPGRTNYSKKTIYQTGDLRRALLGDAALRNEFQSLVKDNAKYCRPEDSRDYNPKWSDVLDRLNHESTEELKKSGYEQFKSLKGNAVRAEMNTRNTITVAYAGGARVKFSEGETAMLKIQAELAAAGVKVDKRSGLNWLGRMQVEWAQRDKREIAATLQE